MASRSLHSPLVGPDCSRRLLVLRRWTFRQRASTRTLAVRRTRSCPRGSVVATSASPLAPSPFHLPPLRRQLQQPSDPPNRLLLRSMSARTRILVRGDHELVLIRCHSRQAPMTGSPSPPMNLAQRGRGTYSVLRHVMGRGCTPRSRVMSVSGRILGCPSAGKWSKKLTSRNRSPGPKPSAHSYPSSHPAMRGERRHPAAQAARQGTTEEMYRSCRVF